MNHLKQKLFTNWHLVRIMRLGIGIMFLVMGFQGRDWAIGLFSIFFLYQAVTDTGCCGSQGCYNPPVRKQNKDGVAASDNVEYEEMK